MRDLTEVLAAIRRFKDISLKTLAQRFDVEPLTVSRWESRQRGLGLDEAQAYAEAIGATITVKIEFEGFSREVPLYSQKEQKP